MIDEAQWMTRHVTKSLVSRARSAYESARVWTRYWKAYGEYRSLLSGDEKLSVRLLTPALLDNTAMTPVVGFAFHQDTWAFGKIANARPKWHVDVGSDNKYVGLLSTILPVTMIDLRPLPVSVPGLRFVKGSVLDLPLDDGSVPSLSSLCVLEHIGLGRYGDPLNTKGTEQALAEMKRVMQPGGDLYLSIPVDEENRTYFNAHRIFTEDYLFGLFAPFEVIESRYIYGNEIVDKRRPVNGVGCYHLRKPLD